VPDDHDLDELIVRQHAVPPAEAIILVSDVAGRPGVDVYPLGRLLWAALTGSPPDPDGPVPQLEQTGSLSVALNRIVRTALAPDPAARYPSAVAMGEDLRKAMRLGEEDVVVAEEDPAGPPGPVRSGALLVAVAVLVVVAAVVVGAFASSRILDNVSPPGSSSSSGGG
jgi:serine/threonine-protein kinase